MILDNLLVLFVNIFLINSHIVSISNVLFYASSSIRTSNLKDNNYLYYRLDFSFLK